MYIIEQPQSFLPKPAGVIPEAATAADNQSSVLYHLKKGFKSMMDQGSDGSIPQCLDG